MDSDQNRLVDRTTPSTPPNGSTPEFGELRSLLVGPEQRKLAELTQRLDTFELTPDQIAGQLPDAVALSAGRDRRLVRALAPTVESALKESVQRNPREIATAIFPILGPAIRKAIAEAMAGLVHSINTTMNRSFSVQGLKWRFESLRSGIPFAEIVLRHSLVFQVEQVFLIHTETGLLLAHVALPRLKGDNADLISGMLTAIQDFVRDSFQPNEGGTLRRFSVGDHTVLVEPGPRAYLAAVVRGEPPEHLVPKLQDTLETIHLQMSAALRDFQGDAAPFETTKPLLTGSLETVLNSDRPASGEAPIRWQRWALLGAVLVALLIGWRVWSGLRWRQALAAIESQPGFTVVRHEHGWWRSQLEGLKDPLAGDPAQLARAAGLDPEKVSFRWESYLSLDSAIVVARARQQLGLPSTATLSVAEDTLYVRGPVPISAVAVAATEHLTPGLAHVDWTQVEWTWPVPLDTTAARLAAQRILFGVGSAALSREGLTRVDQVGTTLRTLDSVARTRGFALEVNAIGRTDQSGPDGANEALSRLRSLSVADRLSRLGVAIGVHGLGRSQPLPPEGGDTALANRSVSFSLKLVPRTASERRP